MKKIISFIVCICLICVNLCVNVSAAASATNKYIDWDRVFEGNWQQIRQDGWSVGGFQNAKGALGKADDFIKYSANSEKSFFAFGDYTQNKPLAHLNNKDSDTKDRSWMTDDVVVFNVDFYDNQITKSIQFQRQVSVAISALISADDLTDNTWNTITMVYYAKQGYSDIYVNGVFSGKKEFDASESTTDFRFVLDCTGNNGTDKYIYLDNIRIYGFNSVEKPVLTSEYTKLADCIGDTVGTVKTRMSASNGAEIKVYQSDGTLAEDSEAMSGGMKISAELDLDGIVIKDELKVPVTELLIDCDFSKTSTHATQLFGNNSTYNVADKTVVNEKLGEKDETDSYIRITPNPNGTDNIRLILSDTNRTQYTNELKTVLSLDVYSGFGFTNVFMQGSGANKLSNDVNKTLLNQNEWNNVTFIYSADDENKIHTQTYINGKYINSYEATVGVAQTTEFRINLNNGDYSTDYIYLDNVKFGRLYGEFVQPRFVSASDDITVSNTTIRLPRGTTADEVRVAASLVEGTALTIPDGTITKDTKLKVVKQLENFGEYYTEYGFSFVKGLEKIFEVKDSFSKATGYNIARAKLSQESGIGEKNENDAVGKLTAAPAGDGERLFFVNYVAGSITQKITATMSVYANETIGTIFFCTNSNAPLGSNITVRDLVMDEWNTISCEYDPATTTSKIYVNGELKSTGKRSISTDIRICFVAQTEKFEDSYIYFDDLKIFTGHIQYPTVTSEDKFGINIYADKNDTADTLLNRITVPCEDYTIEVRNGNDVISGSDKISEDTEVWVYDTVDKEDVIDKLFVSTADYKLSDDVSLYTNGYCAGDDKFSVGDITVSADIKCHNGNINAMTILAQYNEDGILMNCAVNNQTISGNDKLEATLNVKKSAGTTLKFMVLDRDTYKPLYPKAKSFEPYSDTEIQSVTPLYEGYTAKSAVFSYDDCVVNDIRFIELLDKYGMKCTFNLTVKNLISVMKTPSGKTEEADILNFIKETYKNHEIANHSVNHYHAGTSAAETVIADVTDASDYMEQNLGVRPVGVAWANGYVKGRTDCQQIIDGVKAAGIKYARHMENYAYSLPEDWYFWRATCQHKDVEAYVDDYVILKNSGELKCLYMWGHTYECTTENDWVVLENAMQKLASDNIWFATNGDIYEYVEATKLLVQEENTVTNNSDMTVYCQINGINKALAPNEVYTISN